MQEVLVYFSCVICYSEVTFSLKEGKWLVEPSSYQNKRKESRLSAPIAQLVEPSSYTRLVPGSSPGGRT